MAARLPSRVTAIRETPLSCPALGERSLPVAGSQTRIVWSRLAEASLLPSGEKATEDACRPWPRRVRSALPVAGSHRRTVPSLWVEASEFPSGENVTQRTPPARKLRPLENLSSGL